MAPQPKTLQDIFRERRMKDMKREYYFYRIKQFWTLLKRLVLVAGVGYGVHWAKKNPQTLKSFLKTHSAPVQEVAQHFNEGVGMIKEGLKTDKRSKAYHKQQEKRIQEYREMGIDPVVRYAEAGSKEYREELEFYRRSGVFDGRD